MCDDENGTMRWGKNYKVCILDFSGMLCRRLNISGQDSETIEIGQYNDLLIPIAPLPARTMHFAAWILALFHLLIILEDKLAAKVHRPPNRNT